jgi:hypothetical protein
MKMNSKSLNNESQKKQSTPAIPRGDMIGGKKGLAVIKAHLAKDKGYPC